MRKRDLPMTLFFERCSPGSGGVWHPAPSEQWEISVAWSCAVTRYYPFSTCRSHLQLLPIEKPLPRFHQRTAWV